MRKTIVIGVGGTGLEVLRSLRRRIVEDHGAIKYFPQLGFLYIDTDPNAMQITEDNRKRWQVLNTSVALEGSEYVRIEAPSVGRILEDLDAYPQLKSWLPVGQLEGLDTAARDTPGAQQIRALGRMIFTLNLDLVKRKFMAILNNLRDSDPGDAQIYLACSLSGGTGGGIFLDLAYSLREWTSNHAYTAGFLVLPDLNLEAVRGPRYLASAYAALMDLNYFSLRENRYRNNADPKRIHFQLPHRNEPSSGNPFDACYIVGTRNQAGVELSLDALPDMIAHRIYLGFDSASTDDVAAVMNNGAMQRNVYLSDPFNGNRHSQFFSTFGLASIQYPTEQITEILAYRLADALVQGWIKTRPVDNLNQQVEAMLTDLRLIDDYLLGNRDFFDGGRDFPSVDSQVTSDVAAFIAGTPANNKATFLREKHSQYLGTFRGGMIAFYRGLDDNLEGAVQVIMRRVRKALGDAITDRELGINFAKESAAELARLCEIRRQDSDAQQKQLPTIVNNSMRTMVAALGQLTEAENALIGKQGKIRAALERVSASMILNLKSQIQIRAAEFAVKLLGRILERLAELENDLSHWATTMMRLRQEVETEIRQRQNSLLEKRTQTRDFNGAVLFQPEQVEAVYKLFNEEQALNYLRDQAIGGNDPLLLSGNASAALAKFYGKAVQWLTTVSEVRVAHKNVADQLLEQFPGDKNDERSRLFSDNAGKARPFLAFDQGEKEILKNPGEGYSEDGTTNVSLIAMMDDEGNRYPSVVRVRREISAATGTSLSDIRRISDRHQIIFISEATAFPLRLISEVRQLRDRYQQYVKYPKSLPLHIQKTYEPPLGDLLLTPRAAFREHEEAEENFLLGWAEGWLRKERNLKEQIDEVRYRYHEAGAQHFERLGDDWDDAFGFWTSQEPLALKLRQRMATDAGLFWAKLDSQPKRTEFAQRLFGLLSDIQARCRLGEEDPVYRSYNAIRTRMVVKRSLLREGETLPPNGRLEQPMQSAKAETKASAPTRPAALGLTIEEAKYLEAAEDFLARGKGQLSPEMESALKTKQGRLRIPADTASRLLQMARARLGYTKPEGSDFSEYRDMVQIYLTSGGGEIDDEARQKLQALQGELGLSDEQADDLETAARLKVVKVG